MRCPCLNSGIVTFAVTDALSWRSAVTLGSHPRDSVPRRFAEGSISPRTASTALRAAVSVYCAVITIGLLLSDGRGQKPRQSFIRNRYRCSGRVADWLGSLGYPSFLKDS